MKIRTAIPLLAAALAVIPGLVKAERFRIVVVPDTQKSVEEAPEVFLAQMEWIVRNNNDPNNPIVYVATLGDMKDDGLCDVKQVVNPETGATMSEWQILDFGYEKLDDATPRIPYGVVPGNHDYDQSNRSNCFDGDPYADDRTARLTQYNRLFGPGRFGVEADPAADPTAEGFLQEDWYGDPFPCLGEDDGDCARPNNNEDNFTLFSSHGIDFIAINLGYREFAYFEETGPCTDLNRLHSAEEHASATTNLCDLRDGRLDLENNVIVADQDLDLHDTELHWADRLLADNRDRIAIITSHFFVSSNPPRGSSLFGFGLYGAQLYDYLGRHPNLFMMLGAHERGEAWLINNRAGMAPVHGLLSNYQDLEFPNLDDDPDTNELADPATYRSLPVHNTPRVHDSDSFDGTPPARHGNGFSGFMRVMTFDTETGEVDIETFSPLIPPESVANVTTPYNARRNLPAGEGPPNDRVTSARSVDSTTIGARPPPLDLDSATNINGIRFVGYVDLPPTASNVTIIDNDGSADVGDTLSGSYVFNDLDGDVESGTSFRWLRNGLAIDGATGRSYTLLAADAGQQVSFEVTPASSDGPAGLIATSAAVTVNDVFVPDTTPNRFTFDPVFNAPLNTPVSSAEATISGTNANAPISIAGGEYSIDGGAFTAASGSIAPGQPVRIRLTSSASFSSSATATLTIGGVRGFFTVVTPPPPLVLIEQGDLGLLPPALIGELGFGENRISGSMPIDILGLGDPFDAFRVVLPPGLTITRIELTFSGANNGSFVYSASASGPGLSAVLPPSPSFSGTLFSGNLTSGPAGAAYDFFVARESLSLFFTGVNSWTWTITTALDS